MVEEFFALGEGVAVVDFGVELVGVLGRVLVNGLRCRKGILGVL